MSPSKIYHLGRTWLVTAVVVITCLTQVGLLVAMDDSAGLSGQEKPEATRSVAPRFSSWAIRVANTQEMISFYSEVLDMGFEAEDLPGLTYWAGWNGTVRIKLVPIRSGGDFEAFPIHQPGFAVEDLEGLLERALRTGGRIEGDAVRDPDGRISAVALRDPDGNTIEFWRAEPSG